MQQLRSIHRFIALPIALFTLFLGATGTMIQLTDLRSILLSYPATDPNVQAMREAFDGPGFYAVRQVADYAAAALPVKFDYQNALRTTVAAARTALGAKPIDYIEFRMAGATPVGQVGVDQGHLSIDPSTGTVIGHVKVDHHDDESPISARNDFKHLHRMTAFGNWALLINVLVAIGLGTLIVTGVGIWLKLYRARRTIGSTGIFWSAGGMWRSVHRATSIIAAAWLSIVVLSGAWLAFESLYLGIAVTFHLVPLPPPMPVNEYSLSAAEDTHLRSMLDVTLAAAQRDAADEPIKVVRLRKFADYEQGIVVTGGPTSRQLVYNARTGAAMTTTEAGYPAMPLPFGWEAHQTAKRIHRGDYFGLTGRWMDLLSGFAMIYLSISGIVMYATMWRKRRETGRKALVWK